MLTSQRFEVEHGKLLITPAGCVGREQSTYLGPPDSGPSSGAGADAPGVPRGLPSQEYAELYVVEGENIRAVRSAEAFQALSRRDGRTEEAFLWQLVADLLLDAEQSVKYDPDSIGIAGVPPHRQWAVSQQAHIQDLLQRSALLRRMNLIVRWLEAVYRANNPTTKLRRSHTDEEAVLLRQLVLAHLRGGQLHRAIDIAATAGDGVYSCVLSAAQLQTVREPWFSRTPIAPLFGEYSYGESTRPWATNTHRMDNLGQLFEDFVVPATRAAAAAAAQGPIQRPVNTRESLDATIASVLCGNREGMSSAFSSVSSWQDMLWSHLRSVLVNAFGRTLLVANKDVCDAYANEIERETGSSSDWQDAYAIRSVREVVVMLRQVLRTVPIEEELQIRVILHFLTMANGVWYTPPTRARADDATTALGAKPHEDWLEVPTPADADGVRMVLHLLLCLDSAFRERLIEGSVQLHATSLVSALTRHVSFLAEAPGSVTLEVVRWVIPMAARIVHPQQRATVYAEFIRAMRRTEMSLGTPKTDVEEVEERLIRGICAADPVDAVHAEMMRALNTTAEPSLMLTHDPLAEKVHWIALHADSKEDFLEALAEALKVCVIFWCTDPKPRLDAIVDVVRVMVRHILPNVSADSVPPCLLREASFWEAMCAAGELHEEHARCTARIKLLTEKRERTALFQLRQEAQDQFEALLAEVQRAVGAGWTVVQGDPAVITAVTRLVVLLAESATLSVCSAERGESAKVGCVSNELTCVRSVFGIVEEMDRVGYLNQQLLSREVASEVFRAIRTLRIAYGSTAHAA